MDSRHELAALGDLSDTGNVVRAFGNPEGLVMFRRRLPLGVFYIYGRFSGKYRPVDQKG